jgi:hypothetical protein
MNRTNTVLPWVLAVACLAACASEQAEGDAGVQSQAASQTACEKLTDKMEERTLAKLNLTAAWAKYDALKASKEVAYQAFEDMRDQSAELARDIAKFESMGNNSTTWKVSKTVQIAAGELFALTKFFKASEKTWSVCTKTYKVKQVDYQVQHYARGKATGAVFKAASVGSSYGTGMLTPSEKAGFWVLVPGLGGGVSIAEVWSADDVLDALRGAKSTSDDVGTNAWQSFSNDSMAMLEAESEAFAFQDEYERLHDEVLTLRDECEAEGAASCPCTEEPGGSGSGSGGSDSGGSGSGSGGSGSGSDSTCPPVEPQPDPPTEQTVTIELIDEDPQPPPPPPPPPPAPVQDDSWYFSMCSATALEPGQVRRGYIARNNASGFWGTCDGSSELMPELVYRLDVHETSFVTVDTNLSGTTGDTTVYLTSSCYPGAPTLACGDDPSTNEYRGRIEQVLPPGSYYVVVDLASGSNRNGTALAPSIVTVDTVSTVTPVND